LVHGPRAFLLSKTPPLGKPATQPAGIALDRETSSRKTNIPTPRGVEVPARSVRIAPVAPSGPP